MAIGFNENLIEKRLNQRLRLFVIFIVLVFLFVLFRLTFLQIIKGSKYKKLSINNRIRVQKTEAPRGKIFTKNNTTLVTNVPSFDLTLVPQDTPDIETVLKNIDTLLSLDMKILRKKVQESRQLPPFEPITLKKELTWKEMSSVLSKKRHLRGIDIAVVPKRKYCFDSMASHVFGFLGEVDRQAIKKHRHREYMPGDLVGKYGLEKWGEQYLRGYKGGQQTEVDVFGNRQKILAEIEPVPGNDIVVSLIPQLQKKAESLLEDKTGAVVAIEPHTGEILALASCPSFNSNFFSRGIDKKEWNKLIENPRNPLLNRAIQCQQSPGSVFKIVTAIAALEEDIIDPEETFFCPGHFKLGIRKFKCWKERGHGWMNMRQALVESCDTYFYNLAIRVGIENIVKYALLLGFGERTGIELEGEKAGLVPTPEWKKQKYGISWQKGETLNVAIGQGFLLTTPIQVAVCLCGILNHGRIPRPRVVLAVKNDDTSVKEYDKEIIKTYSLSDSTFSFIKDALVGVVNDNHGTGYRARLSHIAVGGKTGTVQVASTNFSEDDDVPYHLRNHAWFASFAPAEDPEIVVVVYLEHGESGGKFAAPIAREIIKSFLHLKKKEPLSSGRDGL